MLRAGLRKFFCKLLGAIFQNFFCSSLGAKFANFLGALLDGKLVQQRADCTATHCRTNQAGRQRSVLCGLDRHTICNRLACCILAAKLFAQAPERRRFAQRFNRRVHHFLICLRAIGCASHCSLTRASARSARQCASQTHNGRWCVFGCRIQHRTQRTLRYRCATEQRFACSTNATRNRSAQHSPHNRRHSRSGNALRHATAPIIIDAAQILLEHPVLLRLTPGLRHVGQRLLLSDLANVLQELARIMRAGFVRQPASPLNQLRTTTLERLPYIVCTACNIACCLADVVALQRFWR